MNTPVPLYRRLTTRVLVFLTLALVPLGIISVIQNQRLNSEVELRTELSLLALTERAASGERQLIQRAFGAAMALSELMEWLLEDTERCTTYLRRIHSTNENLAFVTYTEVDGTMPCASQEDYKHAMPADLLAELVENPRANVEAHLQSSSEDESVMVLHQPSYLNGELHGYVSVALPLRDVGATEDFAGDAQPIILVTFNHEGQMLSTELGRKRAEGFLPMSPTLAELATGKARTFTGRNADGTELVYGIVPVVPDVVYALSSWQADAVNGSTELPAYVSAVLPFLMWLASLFVAWFVIDRFVISRIHRLYRAMQRFARDRTLPNFPRPDEASAELAKLEKAFFQMAEDLVHDEAQQEARLHEKSVLLKEVHHRVKNNLQIISSIMNMQIRKAKSDETRQALSRVQDRILGLSGVHRTLYQAENLTQVDAATLIEQIVEQSRAIGSQRGKSVVVTQDLDHIVVFPDQAVPLSMLVSEALTNAQKYIGGVDPWITLSLKVDPDNMARLQIVNSNDPDAPGPEETESTGLGQQLIRAFATQLNGTLNTDATGGRYAIEVLFKIEDQQKETFDY